MTPVRLELKHEVLESQFRRKSEEVHTRAWKRTVTGINIDRICLVLGNGSTVSMSVIRKFCYVTSLLTAFGLKVKIYILGKFATQVEF